MSVGPYPALTQIFWYWSALSIGLSQLIVRVLPKSPDGAICASVWSSMSMTEP